MQSSRCSQGRACGKHSRRRPCSYSSVDWDEDVKILQPGVPMCKLLREEHSCVAIKKMLEYRLSRTGVLLFILTVFDLPWSRLRYYFVDRVLFIATLLGYQGRPLNIVGL